MSENKARIHMRKLIVSSLVSLDGFFAGPNGETDWHIVDDEFNQYVINALSSVGALLFGRVTYELTASYWHTPAAIENDPIVAEMMNNLPKIVFSKTLERVEWKNTRLVKEIVAEEIRKMKQQPGKDMMIPGSGSIVSALTRLGLIDEYWIMVNSVVLGTGKPLFKDINDRLSLKLLKTKVFGSGNVLLYYEPARK